MMEYNVPIYDSTELKGDALYHRSRCLATWSTPDMARALSQSIPNEVPKGNHSPLACIKATTVW